MIYVGASFGFILATPIAGFLMKSNYSRRAIAYSGYLLVAIGMVIRTGDFGDDPILALSIIGQVIAGAGMATLLCVNMPELVESIEVQEHLSDNLDKDDLFVYLSSLFTFFGACGQAVGGFVASLLSGYVNWNVIYISGGLVMFVVGLVYFTFCGIAPI